MTFNVSAHDSYPPQETALVDHGLGEANDAAAPLHEARPLSCFARTEAGRVVGEARAREHGCATFYLETFSFQTPLLYELLGYTVAYEHTVDPHGIVKYVMVKYARGNENAA
jgi:hypothetical protein